MTRQAYNPLDRRAQERAKAEDEQAQQLAAAQVKADLTWLMSDERGRRLMWQWLGMTGMHQSSFTGDSKTFFREGQRNVGLMLQAQLLQHVPEHWALMFLDHNRPAA